MLLNHQLELNMAVLWARGGGGGIKPEIFRRGNFLHVLWMKFEQHQPLGWTGYSTRLAV